MDHDNVDQSSGLLPCQINWKQTIKKINPVSEYWTEDFFWTMVERRTLKKCYCLGFVTWSNYWTAAGFVFGVTQIWLFSGSFFSLMNNLPLDFLWRKVRVWQTRISLVKSLILINKNVKFTGHKSFQEWNKFITAGARYKCPSYNHDDG